MTTINQNSSSCDLLIWKSVQISQVVSYLSICCLTITIIDKKCGEIAALRRAVRESAEYRARTVPPVTEYAAAIEATFPSATSCHLDEARLIAIKMQTALDRAIETLSSLPDSSVKGGFSVSSMEHVMKNLFETTQKNAEMLSRLLNTAEREISSLQDVLVHLAT